MSRGEDVRPVLLVWAGLAAIVSLLLLRAALAPPPGTVFVGTFYYIDDFYNYLSYVEQAEGGALVFRNKLASPALPAGLVNLEWLVVGWLSELLGGHPLVAYWLFGLLMSLLLVALADRWLRRGGIAPERRLFGLLLVFTGGGLGALLVTLGVLPPERAFDLRAGLYPFVEVLANPHFVAGTALLLAALLAFASGRPRAGVALGTILGLVRPYETALLAAVATGAVLLSAPARQWPRRLLPVFGLAPVLAWNAWILLARPGFRAFSSAHYATLAPTRGELALALGPAALLALSGLRRGPGDPVARRHRVFLALWATVGLVVGLVHPVAFSLQLLVGVGVPLLGLAAIGLSATRRGTLEIAVVLLAGTAVMVVSLVSSPGPPWHVPAARWRVAEALDPVCRRGDVVLAPPDIGLYVGGLTPCWPWVSHAASPEFAARDRGARAFYSSPSGEWRARFLSENHIRAVVLPTPRGPDLWSPEAAGFRRVETPEPGVALFVRDGGPAARDDHRGAGDEHGR